MIDKMYSPFAFSPLQRNICVGKKAKYMNGMADGWSVIYVFLSLRCAKRGDSSSYLYI